MGERLPKLLKELRREVHAVKLRKLMTLDKSDRVLLEQRVEGIINELLYIQTVGEARCSVVVEMFEHMGGTIRLPRTSPAPSPCSASLPCQMSLLSLSSSPSPSLVDARSVRGSSPLLLLRKRKTAEVDG